MTIHSATLGDVVGVLSMTIAFYFCVVTPSFEMLLLLERYLTRFMIQQLISQFRISGAARKKAQAQKTQDETGTK